MEKRLRFDKLPAHVVKSRAASGWKSGLDLTSCPRTRRYESLSARQARLSRRAADARGYDRNDSKISSELATKTPGSCRPPTARSQIPLASALLLPC